MIAFNLLALSSSTKFELLDDTKNKYFTAYENLIELYHRAENLYEIINSCVKFKKPLQLEYTIEYQEIISDSKQTINRIINFIKDDLEKYKSIENIHVKTDKIRTDYDFFKIHLGLEKYIDNIKEISGTQITDIWEEYQSFKQSKIFPQYIIILGSSIKKHLDYYFKSAEKLRDIEIKYSEGGTDVMQLIADKKYIKELCDLYLMKNKCLIEIKSLGLSLINHQFSTQQKILIKEWFQSEWLENIPWIEFIKTQIKKIEDIELISLKHTDLFIEKTYNTITENFSKIDDCDCYQSSFVRRDNKYEKNLDIIINSLIQYFNSGKTDIFQNKEFQEACEQEFNFILTISDIKEGRKYFLPKKEKGYINSFCGFFTVTIPIAILVVVYKEFFKKDFYKYYKLSDFSKFLKAKKNKYCKKWKSFYKYKS